MIIGLSNRTTLKAWLLPEQERNEPKWDADITAIGIGVASALESYCSRSFARAIGDVYEFSADRAHVVLPRYPLEAVTKIEVRDTFNAGWIDQGTVDDLVLNIGGASGLVEFPAALGVYSGRVRITYTGGYFVDPLEPHETGYPTALPGGATALPETLRLAWLQQCTHLWRQKDKLGSSMVNSPDNPPPALTLLTQGVIDLLDPFRRRVLT